jgi:hypothetical protein
LCSVTCVGAEWPTEPPPSADTAAGWSIITSDDDLASLRDIDLVLIAPLFPLLLCGVKEVTLKSER